MSEQASARAGGAFGSARQRMEGAVADVRERVGETRDDLRHRGHPSAEETVTHERRPSRMWMWLLAAIVLIGALALLVARARRNPESPIPETNVRGLEAPRVPEGTAPGLPQRREAVPPPAPPAAAEPPAAEGQTAPPERKLGEQTAQPAQPTDELPATELDVLTVSSGAGPLTSFLESTAPPPKRFVLGMIEFDSGASNVQSSKALDAVADVLKDHPGAKVRIDGYADPTGPAASNQALSQERARQVKKYLVDRGVPTERIETTGKGESQAGAQATDEVAKARRVELVILSH